MFAIIQLKTAALDQGAAFSPVHTVLLLLMLLAIPMIPYAILYVALERERTEAPAAHRFAHPFTRMFAWMHVHQHPHALHR